MSIWAKKVDASGKWNCPQCFCENTTKTCPACNFVKADFAGLVPQPANNTNLATLSPSNTGTSNASVTAAVPAPVFGFQATTTAATSGSVPLAVIYLFSVPVYSLSLQFCVLFIIFSHISYCSSCSLGLQLQPLGSRALACPLLQRAYRP